MDDDGLGAESLPIRVAITITGDEMSFDFAGSAPAARGSINAVRAIVESAVYYVVRCLVGDIRGAQSQETIPTNAGHSI